MNIEECEVDACVVAPTCVHPAGGPAGRTDDPPLTVTWASTTPFSVMLGSEQVAGELVTDPAVFPKKTGVLVGTGSDLPVAQDD